MICVTLLLNVTEYLFYEKLNTKINASCINVK